MRPWPGLAGVAAGAALLLGVAGPASAAALAASNTNPVLQFGDTGPAVSTLQKDLLTLGYSGIGSVSGSFDLRTWLAVTTFERHLPGAATGDVLPYDWAALQDALAGSDVAYAAGLPSSAGGGGPVDTMPLTAADPPLAPGDQGPAVATLQADLMQLGYQIGAATGYFGPVTAAAVTSFQGSHGLAATGVVDAQTLQAILAAMNRPPAPTPASPSTPPAPTPPSQPSGSGVTTAFATSASGKQGTGAGDLTGLKVGDTIAGHKIVRIVKLVATAYGPSLKDNYPYGPFDVFGKPLVPGDVAIDPRVIPLRTYMYVAGYHSPNLPAGGEFAVARDTGGAIKGARIDIFLDGNARQVSNFGVQHVVAYILGN